MKDSLNIVLQKIKEIDSKLLQRSRNSSKVSLDPVFFQVKSLANFSSIFIEETKKEVKEVKEIKEIKEVKEEKRLPRDFRKVMQTVREKLPKFSQLLLLEDAIQQAAQKTQISQSLLKAIIMVGSNNDLKAFSPEGKIGLMQLMPQRAKEFGAQDYFDPQENVLAGAKYLKKLLKIFKNDLEFSLAAYYNDSSDSVKDFGGIPPYQETIAYVQKVKKQLKDFLNESSHKD